MRTGADASILVAPLNLESNAHFSVCNVCSAATKGEWGSLTLRGFNQRPIWQLGKKALCESSFSFVACCPS